jgi:hypothetical protein
MTIATEGTRSLIIGEEKDDIRALGVRLNKEREHKTEKEEVRIHDFGSKRLFERSGKIVLGFGVQLFGPLGSHWMIPGTVNISDFSEERISSNSRTKRFCLVEGPIKTLYLVNYS